ncbi:MAG: hypothetical protein M3Q29_23825 [Chloroflexota bacterium]|nr:hypothetical protein [Chloroflexota bacterium]
MNEKRILALAPDIFFGVRLADSARSLGYELRRVATLDALLEELSRSNPALVVVDLSTGTGRLEEVAINAGDARLVAFGPHVDAESRQAAKDAGFHEVVPNSRLAREGAALLARNLPPDGNQDELRT